MAATRTGEARELDSGKVSSALEYIPTVFDPNSSDSTALVVSEGAQASLQQRSGLTLDLTVRNPTAADASVELPLIYYPGYQVLAASGGLASLTMGANGKATLILAAGFEGERPGRLPRAACVARSRSRQRRHAGCAAGVCAAPPQAPPGGARVMR